MFMKVLSVHCKEKKIKSTKLAFIKLQKSVAVQNNLLKQAVEYCISSYDFIHWKQSIVYFNIILKHE